VLSESVAPDAALRPLPIGSATPTFIGATSPGTGKATTGGAGTSAELPPAAELLPMAAPAPAVRAMAAATARLAMKPMSGRYRISVGHTGAGINFTFLAVQHQELAEAVARQIMRQLGAATSCGLSKRGGAQTPIGSSASASRRLGTWS
jgi:hypothetical protein